MDKVVRRAIEIQIKTNGAKVIKMHTYIHMYVCMYNTLRSVSAKYQRGGVVKAFQTRSLKLLFAKK